MKTIFLPLLALISIAAQAQHEHHHEMPAAEKSSSADTNISLHYNSFFLQTVEEGPRGRNAFSVPNMFMLDAGRSFGRHYVNVDFMGTFEKWTFPKNGTPELLQVGEENARHEPYIDAQHPHSSPIMGLTLSDTISLGDSGDEFKVFFAPRGESTAGPIAFMHRPTGMMNPDAPLGHHVGQDAGHITSTVIGTSAKISSTTVELSTFHGLEPEPDKVDLPLGNPNSYASRLTYQFNPNLFAMGSAAYIKSPESHDPDLDHIWHYSASVYANAGLKNGWKAHGTLIWGLVNGYEHAAALNSFNFESWLSKNSMNIWSRVEVLQRTPAQLDIPVSDKANQGSWVTAVTIGYTHEIAKWDGVQLGLGGALIKDILPPSFQDSYGGDPISGKIFLQAGGLKTWNK